MTQVTIYHNPNCGTSRNTLAMIRNAGIEPEIVHYLETPPNKATLLAILKAGSLTPREIMRSKEPIYGELQLHEPNWTDAQLVDFMLAHPILINRPIVVTPIGVRLCRPSERVLDLLKEPQQGAFTKEDGEHVIDDSGKRLK